MGNEVDFMVHGYVPLNIFGHEVWLTTTHVCLLIVCLFMLVIGLIVNNKMKHATEVPGMVQNIAELYVEMMDGVVQSSMFRHWGKYANYILTIFMFLLFSNISGLFGLRPPTADYGVTLPLALITFVLIQFNAFKWKGVGGYVKDLMDPIPLFLPINIISEFATPVSLSLRLFGNVMAGTIMLALYFFFKRTISGRLARSPSIEKTLSTTISLIASGSHFWSSFSRSAISLCLYFN